MTKNIADTRTGVTEVKTFIDGMRTSRDTKMAELNALKTQLKEQNQRLLQVTQERAKIESKNKVNQKKMEDGIGESDPRFVLNLTQTLANISISAVVVKNSPRFSSNNLLLPCLEIPDPEPYEIRNNFSYLSSLSAHCVKSLVPEGIKK